MENNDGGIIWYLFFILKDTHVIQIGIDGNEDVSFFGVFDGHGGSYTSEYWYD